MSIEIAPEKSQDRIVGTIEVEPSELIVPTIEATSATTTGVGGSGGKGGGKSRKKFSTRISVSNPASIPSSIEAVVVTWTQHRVWSVVRNPACRRSCSVGQ
jgi:hypothetical protein